MTDLADAHKKPLVQLLFSIADDKLVLGHRNADWTGLGPILEEDIAFSALAQDDIAHAGAIYGLIADITGNESADRASLQQTIHDRKNQTYLVQYSLIKAKDGGWMIANVIVENINLGEVYRSQFAEAVENHKGDIDYVVDHWVELMLHNESAEGQDKPGATN